MGKLIYSMITSLDGFVSDASGGFDWAEPDAELHQFVNDVSRSVGTYLYGRRMYETMVYWETGPSGSDEPVHLTEYTELWQKADKVVFSTTLESPSSERTRIERSFDADSVRELMSEVDHDITVDGPELAAHAIRAGLVDEYQLYVCPVIVGNGTRFFPDGVSIDLELLSERRFGSGVTFLRYGVAKQVHR